MLFQIILHHGPLPPPAPNPQPPSFLFILTTLSHSPLEQPQPSVSFHPFYTSPLTQPFLLRPEPNALLTESLPTNPGSAAPWVFSPPEVPVMRREHHHPASHYSSLFPCSSHTSLFTCYSLRAFAPALPPDTERSSSQHAFG